MRDEVRVSINAVRNNAMSLLTHAGVPEHQAEIITSSIIYAHQVGKGTHGLGRLPLYLKKISTGYMSAVTGEKVVNISPVISLLDAKHGFGQVAANNAMHLCIEKALAYGIGLVGVNNSNTFGTAGFITEQATDHNQIGIVLGNAGPAIAPSGGGKPLLGTNPLGIAFPNSTGEFPVSLDMATSVTARGKLRQAAKHQEKIPFGWALDKTGKPTDDPHEALKGSMIPMGGHKGYGLSLAIDILSGLLTGAAFGGNVKSLSDMTHFSNYGHLCMSISVSHFMPLGDWEGKVETLIDSIHSCGDGGQIKIPGQNSFENKKVSSTYISVKSNVMEALNNIASRYDLEVNWS